MVQGLRLLEFGGISKSSRYSIQEVVIHVGFIFKLKKYAAGSDFILVHIYCISRICIQRDKGVTSLENLINSRDGKRKRHV